MKEAISAHRVRELVGNFDVGPAYAGLAEALTLLIGDGRIPLGARSTRLRHLHFDPIWFGILITKTAEIGLVTPPVGLNIFIASATTETPTHVGFRGVMPFVAMELVILAILVSIST